MDQESGLGAIVCFVKNISNGIIMDQALLIKSNAILANATTIEKKPL